MNKKKQKENPLMKDSKKVKNIKMGKISNESTEDGNEIKRFIIIVLVITVIAGVVYFVTEKFTKKDEEEYVDPIQAGSIDYDKVIVGTIFNRPYDDYYVLVYNSEDQNAVKYSNLMATYTESMIGNNKKIFFCDLNNALNKDYYDVNADKKSNPKAKSLEELDFGDLTLLEIKSGKIVKYSESYEEIKDILK